MGKIYSPTINHESHPHPLELSNVQQQQPIYPPPSCSGCKLKVNGHIYTCKPCNFFLHISCSQMPQLITHPAHTQHTLSLLAHPAYPEGFFNCDACGSQGTGFSYSCQQCNLDVHIICATMPLSLNHQSHHHSLSLAFFPPYDTKGFSCDICKNLGSNHWLYRCNTCEFDAHLGCATTRPVVAQSPQLPQGVIQQQPLMVRSPSQFQAPIIGPRPAGVLPNYRVNNMNPGVTQTFRPVQSNGQMGVAQPAQPVQANGQTGNGLMDQMFQGVIEQLGQNIVQSMMGGGDSGGGNGSTDGGGNSFASVTDFDSSDYT